MQRELSACAFQKNRSGLVRIGTMIRINSNDVCSISCLLLCCASTLLRANVCHAMISLRLGRWGSCEFCPACCRPSSRYARGRNSRPAPDGPFIDVVTVPCVPLTDSTANRLASRIDRTRTRRGTVVDQRERSAARPDVSSPTRLLLLAALSRSSAAIQPSSPSDTSHRWQRGADRGSR